MTALGAIDPKQLVLADKVAERDGASGVRHASPFDEGSGSLHFGIEARLFQEVERWLRGLWRFLFKLCEQVPTPWRDDGVGTDEKHQSGAF